MPTPHSVTAFMKEQGKVDPNAPNPGTDVWHSRSFILQGLKYQLNKELVDQFDKFRDAQKPDMEAVEKQAHEAALMDFGSLSEDRFSDVTEASVKEHMPQVWEKYAKAPADEAAAEPEPKTWDKIAPEDQGKIEADWKQANFGGFYQSEVKHWQATEAVEKAKAQLADSFNSGENQKTKGALKGSENYDKAFNDEWAKEALRDLLTVPPKDYSLDVTAEPKSPWEATGHKPLPFAKPTDLVKLFKIELNPGAPGKPEIVWNDVGIGKKLKSKADPWKQFEGFEKPDPAKLFTQKDRDDIAAALVDAFQAKAEKAAYPGREAAHINEAIRRYAVSHRLAAWQ